MRKHLESRAHERGLRAVARDDLAPRGDPGLAVERERRAVDDHARGYPEAIARHERQQRRHRSLQLVGEGGLAELAHHGIAHQLVAGHEPVDEARPCAAVPGLQHQHRTEPSHLIGGIVQRILQQCGVDGRAEPEQLARERRAVEPSQVLDLQETDRRLGGHELEPDRAADGRGAVFARTEAAEQHGIHA